MYVCISLLRRHYSPAILIFLRLLLPLREHARARARTFKFPTFMAIIVIRIIIIQYNVI